MNNLRFSEVARFTDRLPEMIEFYRAFTGSNPVVEGEGMAIFAVGSVKLLLHRTYSPEEGELPPEDHIALSVPDLELECRRLVEKGIRLEVEPTDFPWGRSAYLRDPDGRLLELSASEVGEGKEAIPGQQD